MVNQFDKAFFLPSSVPVVRIEPDRQVIPQGGDTEVRCIATGLPTPTISWTKVFIGYYYNCVINLII